MRAHQQKPHVGRREKKALLTWHIIRQCGVFTGGCAQLLPVVAVLVLFLGTALGSPGARSRSQLSTRKAANTAILEAVLVLFSRLIFQFANPALALLVVGACLFFPRFCHSHDKIANVFSDEKKFAPQKSTNKGDVGQFGAFVVPCSGWDADIWSRRGQTRDPSLPNREEQWHLSLLSRIGLVVRLVKRAESLSLSPLVPVAKCTRSQLVLEWARGHGCLTRPCCFSETVLRCSTIYIHLRQLHIDPRHAVGHFHPRHVKNVVLLDAD